MLTKTIDVQANTLSLAELLTLLQDYTELVLVKDNMPVARLSPIPPKTDNSQPRIPGLHRGTTWMSDDFDDPLPDEFGVNEKRIPGLNAGTLVYISDDFDDPLPDEFWLGEE